MAGRGGRGGGRGGGASGRGGGLFSTGSSLMGGISYNDVVEGSKMAAEAKLYPVGYFQTHRFDASPADSVLFDLLLCLQHI